MINNDELRSKTVLILDDNDLWLKAISLFLKNNGLKNTSCCSNTEQFYTISDNNFDAYIIDFYLDNNIEAPTVIKNLRKKHPNSLIICASGMFIKDGNTNYEKMREALNAGANRVSPKDTNSILDILQSHLYVRHHTDFNVKDPYSFDLSKLSP